VSNNSNNNVSVFISMGFNNWKKAVEKFNVHESSELQKTYVVNIYVIVILTNGDYKFKTVF